MPNELDKVLASEDDFEVCNELHRLILNHHLNHHGEEDNVSKYKKNDQVVVLTWNASGIIDNGGFRYLFECNFSGDPSFAKTSAAFKTIKAGKCAEAFQEAMALFPDSKPPKDIEKRCDIYLSVSGVKRRKIDQKFISESKEIPTHLANFIRGKRARFEHLR